MWTKDIASQMAKPSVLIPSVAIISFASGACASYFITAKRLASKYKVIADQEIADVKQHYKILHKDGEHGDLSALASKYVDSDDILRAERYVPSESPATLDELTAEIERRDATEETEKSIETTRNIFTSDIESDDPDTFFNWEEELKRREESPDEPYVISRDEFNENETGFEQTTLTYYDGDGVLADERDQIVPEVDRTVGNSNVLRFGHGSEDPNIVYVRNERLNLDVEIIKSDGEYSREVLGMHSSLKHSDGRRARRFHHDDD